MFQNQLLIPKFASLPGQEMEPPTTHVIINQEFNQLGLMKDDLDTSRTTLLGYERYKKIYGNNRVSFYKPIDSGSAPFIHVKIEKSSPSQLDPNQVDMPLPERTEIIDVLFQIKKDGEITDPLFRRLLIGDQVIDAVDVHLPTEDYGDEIVDLFQRRTAISSKGSAFYKTQVYPAEINKTAIVEMINSTFWPSEDETV